MLLKDDEIVAEASKDSTYCQLSVDMGKWGATEQLKRVRDWAIEERGNLEGKRDSLKLRKSHNISGQTILGAKIKAFQQVIDKCSIKP